MWVNRHRYFYCSQAGLSLRHTAIAWLGALLRDQFPALQPLGGEVTPSGILYRMMGKVGKGCCDEAITSILSVLNERLKVRLLDAMRQFEGAVSSREMLRSNAVAFLQHRKELLLASLLQEEEYSDNTDKPVSALLALVEIGSHIEPVPFPHAASIEPLRHLHVLSVTSEEREVLGKLRQVWVFHAQIAESSREAKQQSKQTKQSTLKRQKSKNALWIIMDEHQRAWTLEGMAVRKRLLGEWKTECLQRNIPEMITQGALDDESLPWVGMEIGMRMAACSQACIEWLERGKACNLERAGECRTICLNEEEGWLCLYGTSPECMMQISRESFPTELDQTLSSLISRIACRPEHARILLTVPLSMDAFTRSCIEALKKRLSELLPTTQVNIEVCEGSSSGCISLCFLLLDEQGGAWAGPSLTLLTHYKPMLPRMLLVWRAFGVLERWIQWSHLWGPFEKL